MTAPEDLQKQLVTKKRYEHRLLSNPNVAGVGVGMKVTNGEETEEPAIRVYVQQKFPGAISGPNEIPKTIDGIKTDVIQLKITTLAGGFGRTDKVRPLKGGCSVGSAFYQVGGTLTTVVRDVAVPTMRFGLTCYHVLCPTNSASENEDVVQPSMRDGGTAPDAIGKIGWQTLMDGIDCAMIEIPDDANVAVGTVGDVRLAGVGTYNPDRVYKCGKESQITEGKIIDYNLTFDVQYAFGLVYRHHNLFLIRSTDHRPFVVKGDSGSMVYDDRGNAFGMVIGGDVGAKVGAASWIQRILDHHSVTLA